MNAPARRPLLLMWSDAWIDLQGARRLSREHWRITTNRSDLRRADAVLFPMPTTGARLPERAVADQVWILWSQECAAHFPLLDDPEFTSYFDIVATYRLDSDVPIPYVTADHFDRLSPLVPLSARHITPVSAWVSSTWDRCRRDDYLRALMAHIPVDSYGKVAHNADLVNDVGPQSKLATVGSYRFTVAFENSMAPHYVTEKLFQPLAMGSVPIYRGAPDVENFLPSPHCCINADDFDGPEHLAHFLLSMTDEQYMTYHAWRDDGPTTAFRARFQPYATHAFIRLARSYKAIRLGREAARRHGAG